MPRNAFLGVLISTCIMAFLVFLLLKTPPSSIQVTNPNFNTLTEKEIRCGDFFTQEDAQRFFTQKESSSSLKALDRDHDGKVCESLQ